MSKGIFISYSHKDVSTVEQIVGIIERSVNCKVWFDNKLKGGEEYFSVIADKILENEYFIFVVSPNSVISDWCIHELEFAMSEKRKIIAVWLEEFMPPPRVRLVISNTHYIRNYEFPEDTLAQMIAQTLNADHLAIGGEKEYILSEQKLSSEKYFLSPEEKGKIRSLLEKEKSEDFIVCFKAESAVLLGLAYELGAGVEKDLKKADFYYHVAAYKKSSDGEYLELSLKLDREKKASPEIIKRMYELAEDGCVRAQVYWGDELYLGNWGIKNDKDTAYRWFKLAAEAGDPVAKYFLGFGYRTGEIGQEDHAIAWMYFWEAAKQNFPRAYRQIALMYTKGQFVERDIERARSYYNKAIDCGDGLAVNFLGNLEYNQKNYEKAFECYEKAAEYAQKMNLPSASPYYNLGFSYEYGQGTEKDIRKAIDYYFSAVERKHKSSKDRIVFCINDLEDEIEKENLLIKAANLDCTYAEYFLGAGCEKEKDFSPVAEAQALTWFEQGADKGCLYCINKLMEYYSWVLGAKKFADRKKSLENYRLYFSLIDLPENKKYLDKQKGTLNLITNYYCYAIELDIDEKDKKPDKSLAMYYYKKVLESDYGMNFFSRIANAAYNYAEESKSYSMYYNDPVHSEEIAELCFGYIDRAAEYARNEENESPDILKNLLFCYDALTYSYPKDRKKLEFLESRKATIKSYM